MFAELFAFVSMSYLTNLSRGEPFEEVTSLIRWIYYLAYCFIQASVGKSIDFPDRTVDILKPPASLDFKSGRSFL